MKLVDNITIPKYKDIDLPTVVDNPPIKDWGTIGDIISRLLVYVFPLAGIATFVYLLIGGFNYLTAAGNEEAAKKAQGQITNALIGFLIIFLSYWIVRLLEIILGVELL
ncbi:hypothetical protein KBI33_01055 [Candidatus Shapirobacteria bacterium]|nr:hypothetical protein [Candidatus Shapirobacteria bacterium]